MSEIEIKLKWVNDDYFEMTQKKDAVPAKIVVKLEENGSIAEMWGHITNICTEDFKRHIDQIGEEMKK